MNFEVLSQLPNVESIKKQKQVIFDSSTHAAFKIFHDEHFIGTYWEKTVHDEADINNPDYMRLLTLISLLAAQGGMPSMRGAKDRHSERKWQRSVFDPRHQVALASYLGHINRQTFPIKESFAEKFPDNERMQAGVWGLFIRVHKGQPDNDNVSDKREFLKSEVRRRINDPRKIALPNIELNNQLAELHFEGNIADKISDNEFNDSIIPEIEKILGEYIDPYLALYIDGNLGILASASPITPELV